jgi:hypothetical protein
VGCVGEECGYIQSDLNRTVFWDVMSGNNSEVLKHFCATYGLSGLSLLDHGERRCSSFDFGIVGTVAVDHGLGSAVDQVEEELLGVDALSSRRVDDTGDLEAERCLINVGHLNRLGESFQVDDVAEGFT